MSHYSSIPRIFKAMKIRIVFIILPLVIGLVASATGFALVWRLFILSILVPLVSYLWTFFNIRGLQSEIRSFPEKAYVGDVLEDRLQLTNLNKMPKLLLTVKENATFPGYTNISSINLPSRKPFNLETNVLCSKRGQYTLGSFQVSSSDPLGLFKQSRNFGVPQKVLVYPNVVELPFFDPLTYLNQGYGSGRWLESQISPNVASIRDYVSGDSLKHIHWQSTAHSSKLMVKVFDPDRSHSSCKTIWVVLDMCQNSQAGTGILSTEEYGVGIVASVLKKYIEEGWPVGLLAAAERPYVFAPETGSPHLESMTTALATMKAEGTLPIEQLITDEAARFDLNTMLIVVTPSWNEKLITPLLQFKGQQGVIVAIFLDAHSFDKEFPQSELPRSLALQGMQVYLVKSGDNLSSVLDSRRLSSNSIL